MPEEPSSVSTGEPSVARRGKSQTEEGTIATVKEALIEDLKEKTQAAANPTKRKHDKISTTASQANDVVDKKTADDEDSEIHTEKVWFWQDLEDAKQSRIERSGADLKELPANWPPEITVDPGAWHKWLPLDWYQGIKSQGHGDVKVFIGPSGETSWSKAGVEKKVGVELDAQKDDLPQWPSWLPQDWAITNCAKKGGAMKKCYITPGGERYFD